jgi:catechol 2,3-dioxygenase-like lactoylglutathione lyase family enzyme
MAAALACIPRRTGATCVPLASHPESVEIVRGSCDAIPAMTRQGDARMIERIGHINIRTPLLEETLGFYEALFGLRRGPAKTMMDQARNAWLYDADGRAIIHVNMPGQGEAVPGVGDRGRMDHVAFDCRDPDAMEERLAALGIAYRRRPTLVDGLTQIVLRDPNGINLELAFGTERALDRTAGAGV